MDARDFRLWGNLGDALSALGGHDADGRPPVLDGRIAGIGAPGENVGRLLDAIADLLP